MIFYKAYVLILNVIYFFIKFFRTNNKKIFFLSRQSNSLSLDYRLLKKEIEENYPDYKIVIMTKMIGKSFKEKVKYAFLMFPQMYHLATSKTCVIDGYNVVVSILKHKKSLRIIQMWHSLGAIKKFGYQSLDKEYGNSSKVAKVMKMHNNYDLIVTGSNAMVPYFSEAFNQPKEKFINCGLPRIDYLIKESSNNRKKILKKYPKLKKKKIILYVPTFRKNKDYYINQLIDSIDNKKYELIIKGHPLKKNEHSLISKEFTSLELLSIADYVITDYSGIAIESLVLNKPIYFYLYDIEEYDRSVGVNIDLRKEMPSSTFLDASEIINSIENDLYNYAELQKFKKKYLDNIEGDATKKLVSYIIGD